MTAVPAMRTTDSGPAALSTSQGRGGLRGRVPAGLSGQLIRFASIGVASTAAYVMLYLVLRPLGAQQANVIALLITAIANTAANRRLTFAVRGSRRLVRNHLQGLAVFGLGLAMTSGALALIHAVSEAPGRLWEVAALVVANGLATLARFVLLRTWVFSD